MRYYAGLDLGGSHARILLADEQGQPLCRMHGGGISMKMVSLQNAVACFAPLVKRALAQIGAAFEDCAGCCVAASGVDTPELAHKCAEVFAAIGFARDRLLVLNDCEVLLYGNTESAVVLTVGTGSIAFGRVPPRPAVRCGGWGRMLSDEGSGFDMGLRVMRLVANHMDERLTCDILYRLFLEQSDLRRPADIDAFAVEHLLTKKAVAAFAPLLIQAAQQGDMEAAAQLRECVALHCSLVADIVTKLHLQRNAAIQIWLWGGILTQNPSVAESVTGALHAVLPNAVVAYAETEALTAAVSAAMQCFAPKG